MENNNWREALNREWIKDFSTMKTEEIQKIIQLAFYQFFLIDVERLKITSDLDSNGHYVKFEIEGEALNDEAFQSENLMENKEED